MKYMMKQFTGELKKNRIFILLLFLLCCFTSYMYFFVHFSIDSNQDTLNNLPSLTENQVLYQNALASNTILARNVLLAFLMLTGFVFVMFYYRFYKSEAKTFGCLKAMGYPDREIVSCFLLITALFSLLGSFAGLIAGYFTSEVLIRAAVESYLVTGLTKGIHTSTLFTGIFLPPLVFSLIPLGMYSMVKRKEAAMLITNNVSTGKFPLLLKAADKIAGIFPESARLPVRLSLRKPVPAALLVFSVAGFTIMFILAYSLTLSSTVVYRSQTQGHNYDWDTRLPAPRDTPLSNKNEAVYLSSPGSFSASNDPVIQTLVGIRETNGLLELQDSSGNVLPLPVGRQVIINQALSELYGLQIGDTITVSAETASTITSSAVNTSSVTSAVTSSMEASPGKSPAAGTSSVMTISGVAFNASFNCIYLPLDQLADMLSLPSGSYSGIWSMFPQDVEGTAISREQKLDELARSTVSNKSSAVINQLIGCIIGIILLYLALLFHFQDSTRDILILSLMGYEPRAIRKMLIDIYKPILWLCFFLTILPGIWTVKSILRSLSLQIGDYMPFQTNLAVIGGIFLLLNLIYCLVQLTFQTGIRRIITREDVAEYTA